MKTISTKRIAVNKEQLKRENVINISINCFKKMVKGTKIEND